MHRGRKVACGTKANSVEETNKLLKTDPTLGTCKRCDDILKVED